MSNQPTEEEAQVLARGFIAEVERMSTEIEDLEQAAYCNARRIRDLQEQSAVQHTRIRALNRYALGLEETNAILMNGIRVVLLDHDALCTRPHDMKTLKALLPEGGQA